MCIKQNTRKLCALGCRVPAKAMFTYKAFLPLCRSPCAPTKNAACLCVCVCTRLVLLHCWLDYLLHRFLTCILACLLTYSLTYILACLFASKLTVLTYFLTYLIAYLLPDLQYLLTHPKQNSFAASLVHSLLGNSTSGSRSCARIKGGEPLIPAGLCTMNLPEKVAAACIQKHLSKWGYLRDLKCLSDFVLFWSILEIQWFWYIIHTDSTPEPLDGIWPPFFVGDDRFIAQIVLSGSDAEPPREVIGECPSVPHPFFRGKNGKHPN